MPALPFDAGDSTYRYAAPYAAPVFANQSCESVASWLRLMAQKNALLMVVP
jgi:hypothetical protein